MNRLTIIRGLPGSGKSTLAKTLIGYDANTLHFEADMFFVYDSIYKFNSVKLKDAHEWCLHKTEWALNFEYNVIVSNTFTTLKELRPYLDLADKFNIQTQIILCQGTFGSIHNVPAETMTKMRARFQYELKD